MAEDRLAQAIGKGGQNVRLASRLTGWQLNVMTWEDKVAAKSEAEQAVARQLFQDKLEVDEEIAGIPGVGGFSTVEEIAYVPVGELLAVEGFDEDIVEELRSRARDALLNDALAVEEEVDEHQPAEDLLALEGMDEETAFAPGRPRRAHQRGPVRPGGRRGRRVRHRGAGRGRAAALIPGRPRRGDCPSGAWRVNKRPERGA